MWGEEMKMEGVYTNASMTDLSLHAATALLV